MLSPVLEAIARIGGRRAVALYDGLLDRGGDYRWLRRSRDGIAAAVLRERGRLRAAAAATALNVPAL